MVVVKKIRRSKSDRAGLIFPVSKVRRFLRAFHGFNRLRISEGASVYAAAIMEYLAAELLELSGNACKALKMKRLSPRHLMLAIQNDAELEKLLRHVTIPQAGVVPNIWPALLPAKASSGAAAAARAAAPKPTSTATAVAAPSRGTKKFVPLSAKALANVAKQAKRASAAPGGGFAAAPARRAAAAAAARPAVAKSTGGKKVAAAGAAGAAAVARPKLNVAILSEKQLHGGQKLTVLKGDITTVQADAIVHPTSSGYPTGGQVGHAIVARGGAAMRAEIQRLAAAGPLASCAAKACPARGLGSDWVINCHGPSWNTGQAATLVDDLEKTVKNCLALAESKNFASVALPSIGSGSAGFPKHTAAQTILQTIRAFFSAQMSSSMKQVYFVLYDQESIDVYTSELEKLDV